MARILCLADGLAACSYEEFPLRETVQQVVHLAGRRYDPEVVVAFVRLLGEAATRACLRVLASPPAEGAALLERLRQAAEAAGEAEEPGGAAGRVPA